MNYQILALVIEELSALLTGARLGRVIQDREGGLYFLFRRNRKNYALLCSPDRALPRMHLVSSKPLSVQTPHPFILALRSRLTGSHVKNISLLNQDRIVRICFEKSSTELCLVFELTGRSANLFFIGADSRIIAAYYSVTPHERAERTLSPGVSYVLPRAKDIFPADKDNIAISDSDSPSNAVEAYYAQLTQERCNAALGSEVRSSIRKALVRAERRRDALESDLRSSEHAEQLKEVGDLILANLNLLHGGMDHAELTSHDSRKVVVQLDQKLSPLKNAEFYFKKYKKAKAGQQIISTRLHDAVEEISFLNSLLDETVKPDNASHLEAVRSELSSRGYLQEKSGKKGKASPDKNISGSRTIVYRGWEILIGTNALGNDHITTKMARPDDIWLHAEGLPGSHVLVRNAMKGELPLDVLLKAAALAAYYSKGRNAGKVPVTYTYARFVKKPKGAKPGLVMISERKTVMVTPTDHVQA
ncbi:MAG TPA: NFACT family protein [Nitrospirota bacterium]|nr:NFACT family protein [Nitrospirota bacterium]